MTKPGKGLRVGKGIAMASGLLPDLVRLETASDLVPVDTSLEVPSGVMTGEQRYWVDRRNSTTGYTCRQ